MKPKIHLGRFDRGRGGGHGGFGGFNLRLRGLHLGLRRGYLRFLRLIGLPGVVQILLRDRLLLRQRNIAIFVELRFVLVGLGAQSWARACSNPDLACSSCALACANCPWA